MLAEGIQMRFDVGIKLNIKDKEVNEQVKKACQNAMRDTVVAISHDAIEGSPVLTGNNRRSIKHEVGPNGEIARGEIEGAVYSTSGYGGYLETGTVKMEARPYFKPALDRHFTRNKFAGKIKKYLGS